MRVLLVIHSIRAGGAERIATHLANAWARRGWEVTVATLESSPADFYSVDSCVYRVSLDVANGSATLFEGLVANIRRVRELRRLIKKLNPDVVLGMMTTAGVLGVLAATNHQCRVLVSERIHPAMMPISRIWAALRRITYPWADRVVMLSQEGLRWLEAHVPNAKGAVIPNPVPYPLPAGEPVLSPAEVVSAQRKLLLAVGRLDVQKGFDLLLESFVQLLPQHPSWDLVILGEGPQRVALNEQITRLGLQGRVMLPGRAGNMGDWYGRADLYVMSSRFEGFPNTLAEAMAHACPVVSYDCDTGPRDIIRHEYDGVLVKPVGDVPRLTDALDRLMSNEADRKSLAARAVEVRERFSVERVLEMWERLFQPVCKIDDVQPRHIA
jgi:glycosyltransferase involved in cell wall biosynthesis